MTLQGQFELLDAEDVKRAFGNICDAAGVAESLNARLGTLFAGSIGLNVEICSAVESPLTCTEVIKQFLRVHRSGLLTKCCPPYDVLSVEVAEPLQLWPRIIAYEHALYGALDHPEVQFSTLELEDATTATFTSAKALSDPEELSRKLRCDAEAAAVAAVAEAERKCAQTSAAAAAEAQRRRDAEACASAAEAAAAAAVAEAERKRAQAARAQRHIVSASATAMESQTLGNPSLLFQLEMVFSRVLYSQHKGAIKRGI